MSRHTRTTRSVVAAFVVGTLAGAVDARLLAGQATWLRAPLVRSTSLEVMKVDFAEDVDLTALSVAIYAGTGVSLGRDLLIVGELPYATRKIADSPFSTQAVGNPYIGLEWRQTDALVWEIGTRIPIGDRPNGATAMALSGDAADRLEAWAGRAFSFQLTPNLIHRDRDGWMLRLRAGPSLYVPTGFGGGDSELLFAYGGRVGYAGGLVHLLGGVSGRVVTTGEGESFNHLVASVAFDLGGFRPVAILRIPFGDLEGVDAVYGIGFSLIP